MLDLSQFFIVLQQHLLIIFKEVIRLLAFLISIIVSWGGLLSHCLALLLVTIDVVEADLTRPHYHVLVLLVLLL